MCIIYDICNTYYTHTWISCSDNDTSYLCFIVEYLLNMFTHLLIKFFALSDEYMFLLEYLFASVMDHHLVWEREREGEGEGEGEGGRGRASKNGISRQQKELFSWIKKHFSYLFKGYRLEKKMEN